MTILIPTYIDNILVPVEKLLVHRQGLKHLAISIFVVSKGRILLQRRALSKYHTPGLWANTCCTHPLWEEDTTKAASRRLNEELGMTGISLIKRDTIEYKANVPPDLIEHEVADIFVGKCKPNHSLTLNFEEVMDIKWITPEDLSVEIKKTPEIFTAWLKIYMEQHADKIFNENDYN